MGYDFNNRQRAPAGNNGGGQYNSSSSFYRRVRRGFATTIGSGRGRGGTTTSAIPAYVWVPIGIGSGLFVYGYYSCLEETPLTKRKRWIGTSIEWERNMGDHEYKQLLQKFKYDDRSEILPPSHRASITVKRVGNRIADASKIFATEHNNVTISPSPYTYTVIRNDMANAFVLPNNHVFVMTGLFNYVKNEDELAAVLGHEVGHNLSRHAGEKASGSLLVNILARLFFIIDPSGFMSALFIGSSSLLHDLPHSREAESEADQIGINLAAIACYDPSAAKRVFAAMKEGIEKDINNKNGNNGSLATTLQQKQPPEFLSTHPSHDTRISNFDIWLPKAMDRYVGDGGLRCKHIRHEMKKARQIAAIQHEQRERVQQQQQ